MASSLSQNRPFQMFMAGQIVSNLGDAFGFVAMPLLVFDATKSVVEMGRVTAVAVGGQVVTAICSGAIVDRVHRRHLMIACDFARVGLYGALPILVALGGPTMTVVYAVAFLTAIASNLFFVAYMTAVANLVPPEDVAPANARLQASQVLTYVVGSALAGVVCGRLGTAWAFGIDAVSFLASAAALSRVVFRRDTGAPAGERSRGILSDLRVGVAFLVRHGVLRALAILQTGVALMGSIGVGSAVIDLLVYRLRNDLSESGTIVGISLACSSLGAVLGAIGASKSRRRLTLGAIAVTGTGIQSVGLLCVGLGGGAVAVTGGGLLWAGGLTFRGVGAMSLRQTVTPDALLGRVVAAGWILIFSASAVGALFVTRLAASLGAAPAAGCLGAVLAVVTIGAWVSPVMQRPERESIRSAAG